MIGQAIGARIFADTEDEARATRIGQIMTDFFVMAKGENVPVCLPQFVFCRLCNLRVEWLLNQGDIVCEPLHHIVATFSEKQSEAAS